MREIEIEIEAREKARARENTHTHTHTHTRIYMHTHIDTDDPLSATRCCKPSIYTRVESDGIRQRVPFCSVDSTSAL